MSRITDIIPSQAFELIRDRIAEILADELENQSTLANDADIDADVFLERMNPFQSTEMPAINVSLASGTYGNKNQGSVDGTYTFHVDVYTNAKTTDYGAGGTLSHIKLQKLLGKCRAILENPIYKTLGFTPPFISRIFYNGFDVAQADKDDATNTAMARMTFTVVANETTSLIIPELIKGYETRIKLDTTDQGYITFGGLIARVAEDGRLRITQSGLRRITS